MVRSKGPWSPLAPVGLYIFLLHKQASETTHLDTSSHSYDSGSEKSRMFVITALDYWVS